VRPLDLQSEQFAATGGAAAEGISKQLGRPRMDRLEILVREAVQNSWDARASGEPVVQFGISCWTATREQQTVLLQEVFAAAAPGMSLHEELSVPSPRLLVIYDRGTNGLGGKTRADTPATRDEPTDFVDFFRNIGQPPSAELRGGTYGFGKTALYLASRTRAICVHTRCRVGARVESRFMAAGLGQQTTAKVAGRQKRLTGRHWWGRLGPDHIVDPLTGADADALATALHLPGYPRSGCGTTILIPAPDFGEREPADALEILKKAIIRYFWPKQIDGAGGSATIEFQLALDGKAVPVPRPEDVPALQGFVQAFAALQGREETTVPVLQSARHSVACQKPAQDLGALALVRYLSPRPQQDGQAETDTDTDTDTVNDPLAGPCHYAALMRTPHFVVRYLSGPPMPYSHTEYAAVFQANRKVDSVFAEAEPPAHDDWVPDSLSDSRRRTFVRVALRRIRKALLEFAAPLNLPSPEGLGVPLGELSDQLAGLIASQPGTGARSQQDDEEEGGAGRTRSAGDRQPLARIKVAGPGRIELVRGVPALVIDFEIEHRGADVALVAVDVGVTLEGGGVEADPPAGADQPKVLEWRRSDGTVYEGGGRRLIPANSAGRWSVAVSVPADAKIGASVRVERPAP
jgi:hypothetical protein